MNNQFTTLTITLNLPTIEAEKLAKALTDKKTRLRQLPPPGFKYINEENDLLIKS